MHLLLAVVLAGSPADTLRLHPGHEAVEGGMIRPYEVVWVQYFETEGNRILRRTIVDRVERESGPDGDRLVRTQTFLDLDGDQTSKRVNRVHGVTLEPLRERWWYRERVTHVDYEGRRVSGAMIDGSAGEPALIFDEQLPESGFDFNVVPLILASLDLTPGSVLRFPHVRISPPAYPTPEIARATVEVERREEVDAGPLGRVQAWRAVDPAHDMVFWLIPEAPYLVRVAFPIDVSTHSVMELGAVRSDGGDG